MARSRNIKPGFFTNDILCELPPLTRLLFAGLWTICDRDGRVEDRPKKIRAEVLPYDDCDVDSMLDSLEFSGFILRYEAGGVRAIQIVEWEKHQNPHVKESPSTIQAPDKHQTSTIQAPDKKQPLPERAGLIPDSGFLIPDSLYNSTADKSADIPPGFAKFWDTWPTNDRKQAKGKCRMAWKKASAERDAALVLAHVESLKNGAWLKDGGQFVPSPLVYLNQRRWEGADVSTHSNAGGVLPGAI